MTGYFLWHNAVFIGNNLRADFGAVGDLLQALDDYLVFRGQAGFDNLLGADCIAEGDAALFGNIVFDDHDVVAVFILRDGGLRDEQNVLRFFGADFNVDVVSGDEQVFVIFIFGINGDGCRVGIDFVIGKTGFEMIFNHLSVRQDDFAANRTFAVLLVEQFGVQIFLIRNGKGDANRVGLDNARQILRRGADVVAFGDQRFADIAGNRCLDFGITEVDFGKFQIGFRLGNRGFCLEVGAFRRIKGGFGSVILFCQL